MNSLINSEKTLINSIRYGAIVIIIVFSLIITNIFINQKNKNMQIDIQDMEKNYILDNKNTVKSLVEKIYNFIEVEKEIEEQELKNSIKEQVNQAYSVMEGIYKQSIKDKNYSKDKSIELIKESIRNMRFSDDLGYIFIYDFEGKNILNAQYPQIESKNHWNYQDAKGTFLLQEMKKLLNDKNEVFYSWYWKKPNDKSNKEFEKLGFFKKFEPYDIFIASGEYIEDFNKKLKEKILKKFKALDFKGQRHLFIYETSGLCLLNPKKELIGTNRYDSYNKDGEYILKDIINSVTKEKEVFKRYKSSVVLNENNITNDKISFLKIYEPWNWIIGSGFFLEELEIKTKEKENKLIQANKDDINTISYISFLATSIMIIFCFYLSNLIAKLFKNYTCKIEDEIKKSHEKEKLLIQQSKMATMGEMLGNIAHQWKQPLSLIAMSNTLIKLNKEKQIVSSDFELNEASKNIDISVKHLSQTIDDFRDFFKPEKEKIVFNIEHLITKTHELISSQFKNNNIEIVKNIENIDIYGRSNELLQVLINIIKNAKDELIKQDIENRRLLFIDIYKKDLIIYIKIKDNAGGIDNEILDKIFDPYFTTKEHKDGTGIGLYMSKQIIEDMNGEIKVANLEFEYENKKHFGAEFTICLNLENK